MTSQTTSNKLEERLLKEDNIFLAISSLNSYVQETKLLSKEDQELLIRLRDIFNEDLINQTIKDVKEQLVKIKDEPDFLFKISVYFKPKKKTNDNIEFRPIHTAKLIDQIAMVSMLQLLVYDIDNTGKLIPSELSRLIPSTFYGNRISYDGKRLFKPWQSQYQKYSSNANNMLYEYSNNMQYKYEVSLDLENFFPSINPRLLFEHIFSFLPLKYSNDETELMKTILCKLLYFEINSLNKTEYEWYLQSGKLNNTVSTTVDKIHNIGLPQGLPHAYFFANLYMLLIKEAYEEAFGGEAVYYVDDSVIFTNKIEEKDSHGDFENKIKKLNSDLNDKEQRLLEKVRQREPNDPSKIFYQYDDSSFSVKVHEPGDSSKSFFTSIQESKKRSGEMYLQKISRETSKTSFDMYTIFSDSDVRVTKSRITALFKAINEEIDDINSKIKQSDNNSSLDVRNYLEKLLRYKKYFKYRMMLLNYIEKDNIEDLIKEITTELKKCNENEITDESTKCNKNDNIDEFFKKYNDDILAVSISFIFERIQDRMDDPKLNIKLKELKKELRSLIYKIHNISNDNSSSKTDVSQVAEEDVDKSKRNLKYSYLMKVFSEYLSPDDETFSLKYKMSISKYDTLYQKIKAKYFYVKSLSTKKKFIRFQDDLEQYLNEDKDKGKNKGHLFASLGLNLIYEWSYFIRSNTDEMERLILNALFSYIFSYNLDDSFNFAKSSRLLISYAEIRILALLRNKQFNLKNFLHKYKNMISENYIVDIDYSLLQVMEHFNTFIRNPKRIDNLILIHKYCYDTWKNGSKYLHFYTLHNQEHAVSLIHSSIEILHSISYFQIKPIDYYVLFAACYLHDISMVTLPEINKFAMEESNGVNNIVDGFCNSISDNNKLNRVDLKMQLVKVYEDMDEYYESIVRDEHARNSASEIRKHSELDFLDETMRDLIAGVSEAHGFDTNDVYNVRSRGKDTLTNEKFIKILLRLSDLLDISRYRISNVVLYHNLKNLNEVSRFHWISHLITKGYRLETVYRSESDRNSGDISENLHSRIANKAIIEKLIINVEVLMSQTTEIENTPNCKNVSGFISNKDEDLKIKILFNQEKCEEKCSFLCRWFMKKNEYLINELVSLKNYLNMLDDNFFQCEIEVHVDVVQDTNISNEVFDYLRDFIEK